MKKYCWFTVALQLGHWTLTSCTEMKRSRILWSKTFWGLKPIFGYGTDFLNGHTGKSLSQSCQSTATKLQHGAACVSSQHKYQLQPHTSPTDQPKLKTQNKQSPDVGALPNSRLLRSICYRQVPQTWGQLPAHGENQIICVTGKKKFGESTSNQRQRHHSPLLNAERNGQHIYSLSFGLTLSTVFYQELGRCCTRNCNSWNQ